MLADMRNGVRVIESGDHTRAITKTNLYLSFLLGLIDNNTGRATGGRRCSGRGCECRRGSHRSIAATV